MKFNPLVWLVFLVLASQLAIAVGTCTLDQATYFLGETAVLSCSCTAANEKNVAGYIVFKNTTQTVYKNISVNSGDCVKNVFGDSYTFVTSPINGTAYFETSDTGWNGAGDNKTDNFQVYTSGPTACLIPTIMAPPTFTLGNLGTVKIEITDQINGHPIINALCRSEAYDLSGVPILSEPYGDYLLSSSDGELIFSHTMSEDYWETNTTYLYEFHCHCPANSTIAIPDRRCYDEVTGNAIGFRSCSRVQQFTTGIEDHRQLHSGSNLTLLMVIILLPFLFGVALMVSAFIFGPQHAVLKIFLFFCPFLCFFVSMQMAAQTLITYYGFDDLVNIIGDTTYWTAFTLFVLISYIIVYVIVALSKSMLSKGKTEFEI